MDLDAYFESHPMGQCEQEVPPDFRSGFVALVGRPNAGKSTLINALVGHKVAITSSTAQTTRHRFQAVCNRDAFQMVLVDTPGIHKPHDALGEELNISAENALSDVDVAAMLIDAHRPIGRGDEWVANLVKAANTKKIGVLAKADLATEEELVSQRSALVELADWDDICVLSAKTGHGVEQFVDCASGYLPHGPKWFPDDMDCSLSEEVLIAEFIREKVLRNFRDEIPHAIGVDVEHMDYQRKKDLMHIWAVVYVERESQKGIIIGKAGRSIRLIGEQARADLERLLACRVYLDLSVKCKRNWRRDANQIRRFGYGE